MKSKPLFLFLLKFLSSMSASRYCCRAVASCLPSDPPAYQNSADGKIKKFKVQNNASSCCLIKTNFSFKTLWGHTPRLGNNNKKAGVSCLVLSKVWAVLFVVTELDFMRNKKFCLKCLFVTACSVRKYEKCRKQLNIY